MKFLLHALPSMLVAVCALAAQVRADDAAVWHSDFTKAHAIAKQDNKLMVLNFTGSDWCGWCIKMKKETLQEKAFLEYAAKHFVLVDVDFPSKKRLPAGIRKTNDTLQSKYGVNGYPTFVIIDKNGKEIGRQGGYLSGGPTAFIEKLEGFRKASAGK